MARYKSTSVNGKTTSIHRLVWIRAHGPIPKGYEIHHKNGIGTDNSLKNLTCITISEHRKIHAKARAKGKDIVDPNDPDVIEHRMKSKLYRLNNQELVRKQQKDYYDAHHEERIAYSREYKDSHRDQVRAYSKKYHREHAKEQHEQYEKNKEYYQKWRDDHREDARCYRQENKDHIREMHTKYRNENRPIVNALHNLNHMRKRGLSPEELEEYEEAVWIARERVKHQMDLIGACH